MKFWTRIFWGVIAGVIVMAICRLCGVSDFATGLWTGVFSNIAQDLVYRAQKS